jgi:hypothetical protein
MLSKRLEGSNFHVRSSRGTKKVYSLFSLIIAFTEPLTFAQLQHAYAAAESDDSDETEDWMKYLLAKEGILDVCGDFIHINNGRIHLRRVSVEDYMAETKQHLQTRQSAYRQAVA